MGAQPFMRDLNWTPATAIHASTRLVVSFSIPRDSMHGSLPDSHAKPQFAECNAPQISLGKKVSAKPSLLSDFCRALDKLGKV
jgi:hypothetical protein